MNEKKTEDGCNSSATPGEEQEEKFSCNSETQAGSGTQLKERPMDQQNISAFSLWNEHWTRAPGATLEKHGKSYACL